jgi:hypothetical protein
MKAIIALALSLVMAGSAVYILMQNPVVFDFISLFSSAANGRMDSSTWENDVQLRNGWPDAGITTIIDVTNTAKKGLIMVSVTLSCSEGDWEREQKMLFDAGEARKVEFFFQEPTIHATNIETRTRVIP